MARNRFLVSVFDNGKNVNSFFSECLDDLVTIRAIHKGCEITIFDIEHFAFLTDEQVDIEVRKSGERWKLSMERCVQKEEETKPVPVVKEKRRKPKKYWERPVMCVETGQIFPSIRDCSEKTGIPYMTITNCIRRKNATRGVHFVNATNREKGIIED